MIDYLIDAIEKVVFFQKKQPVLTINDFKKMGLTQTVEQLEYRTHLGNFKLRDSDPWYTLRFKIPEMKQSNLKFDSAKISAKNGRGYHTYLAERDIIVDLFEKTIEITNISWSVIYNMLGEPFKSQNALDKTEKIVN